ncbi:MAG: OB-fold domain-containing protein [Actinobacteria bacterium]|nr:OB-fold domain-containing protein [Actinomycetota bacterium]
MSELGIVAVGAYVPPLRLSREEVAAANSWLNPGLRSLARGERSLAGWDEDTITMAVEAARSCLEGRDRSRIGRVYLGSTTAPFADRLNAGVVAGALGLRESVSAFDLGGSLRAGTSALLAAFDAAAGSDEEILCLAAERRRAPAAAAQELVTGHAGAAVLVARGPGLARLVATRSLTVDFVDHFRAADREFDYQWEERWIRDEGYLKLVPRLVGNLLESSGVDAGEIAHFCLPSPIRRVADQVAKASGIPEASVRDQLADGCGDSGAAHPLLQLASALEHAAPGELVLVVGFGQGGDALLFQTTDAVAGAHGGTVEASIARRAPCTYPRYLALNGLLKVDRGMRAEADKGTALTAAYRHSDLLLSLTGGKCEACGTHQIPRTAICVNPDCRALDTQVPHSFAESRGRVATWSSDSLTFTPDPPAYYGQIDFEEGGRLLMDFAGVPPEGVDVGTPMRMVFRVKDHDPQRGFSRYFWKATPALEA